MYIKLSSTPILLFDKDWVTRIDTIAFKHDYLLQLCPLFLWRFVCAGLQGNMEAAALDKSC
jgi:hypothetical protein